MTIKGKFRVDVYQCDVTIIVTDDITTVTNKRYVKDGYEAPNHDPHGLFYRCGKQTTKYYIFYSTKYLDHNSINHEKSHLVDYILKDREIKSHDEVRAYLDGYISFQIYKFFKKHKIDLKS